MELSLENTSLTASIDDEDVAVVATFKWYLNKKTGYVYGYFGNNRKQYLHRFILGLPKSRPMVDHRDGNRRNCHKKNLRVCSNQQNTANQRKRAGRTSSFKGVSWEKRIGKWRATIVFMYKQTHIGTFNDELEAARAYDSKAIELFGEFAKTNFGRAA